MPIDQPDILSGISASNAALVPRPAARAGFCTWKYHDALTGEITSNAPTATEDLSDPSGDTRFFDQFTGSLVVDLRSKGSAARADVLSILREMTRSRVTLDARGAEVQQAWLAESDRGMLHDGQRHVEAACLEGMQMTVIVSLFAVFVRYSQGLAHILTVPSASFSRLSAPSCHSVARWRLRLVYCMGILGIYESRIRGKGTVNANL